MTDDKAIYEITLRHAEAAFHEARQSGPEQPQPRPNGSTPVALAAAFAVGFAGWIGWDGGARYAREQVQSPERQAVTWSTPIEADQGRPRTELMSVRLPEIEIAEKTESAI